MHTNSPNILVMFCVMITILVNWEGNKPRTKAQYSVKYWYCYSNVATYADIHWCEMFQNLMGNIITKLMSIWNILQTCNNQKKQHSLQSCLNLLNFSPKYCSVQTMKGPAASLLEKQWWKRASSLLVYSQVHMYLDSDKFHNLALYTTIMKQIKIKQSRRDWSIDFQL